MILITTRDGKLVQDGEFIKSELFQPSQKYDDGDLSVEASTKNIHGMPLAYLTGLDEFPNINFIGNYNINNIIFEYRRY